MFNKSIISKSLALALIAPSFAAAEVTATFQLRNETAVYTQSGQTIGQPTTQLDSATNQSGGELMKFQNQVKAFINGDIGEDSTWHAELQLIYDSEAIDDEDTGGVNYKGHEDYTQNDFFRELYVDTEAGDWLLRLGKQQVVWGTADGIKLLDIINPTDFREVNQNVMEDSRLPIWMINAERDVGDAGNIQFIVSQVETNKIPGLNPGGDEGQPFIMKGVDTISGQVNGFYNIAPQLGKVSNSFNNFAKAGAFLPAGAQPGGLTGFTNLTVDGFADQDWNVAFAGALPQLTATNAPSASNTGAASNPLAGGNGTYQGNRLLNTFANDPNSVGTNSNGTQGYQTNLTNITAVNNTASTVTWNPTDPKSTFDHMPNATFATFNTFAGNNTQQVGAGNIPALTTEWVRDLPDDEANAGFRFKGFTDSGINYSLNYFYHYDSNPHINLSYHDAVTNEKLTTELRAAAAAAGGLPTGAVIDRSAVSNAWSNADANTHVSVLLKNSAGQYYGAVNPTTGGTNDATHAGNGVKLRFTETQNRIHSLGASFDMAVDSFDVPLVIRGEFLYDQDVMQPVVDKRLLAIGDLEGALVSEETDFFKYVLGADITVMTNLLVSAQFIQFINLDFVDTSRTCTTQFGSTFDCSRYTADPTTMSISNSLQKGYETKEWVSLFLSKPIGEEQLGRWNNITIWEEGGGWWNRLDAEYSLSDSFIVNAEWNHYWGDDNTTFGQLENSSNVQVGFKYIFGGYY